VIYNFATPGEGLPRPPKAQHVAPSGRGEKGEVSLKILMAPCREFCIRSMGKGELLSMSSSETTPVECGVPPGEQTS